MLDASDNQEEIIGWRSLYPDAHIGARTDERPRVDIDDIEIADALANLDDVLRETDVVRTPSGGLHITFDAAAVRTSKLMLADRRCIGDLKAERAYVVVPPSRIGPGRYQR